MEEDINKELEKIKFNEKMIYETAHWWSKEINEKNNKLKQLLSRDDSSYEEIEELQRQIEILQKKGIKEQKFIEDHEKKKAKILFNCMLSGCLGMNLDYRSHFSKKKLTDQK